MKRINPGFVFFAAPLLILLSCSKGSSYQPPATPTNLSYHVEIVGATTGDPAGDGSGVVHLSLSGKNVTSYAVSLPTENKTYSLTAASGTVDIVFSSGAGTTTKYPINISAYCNTVKADTTLYASVYVSKPETPGTVLVWSDEFDSTALNTNVWNYETGNLGVNNELEYYTKDADNLQVKDGYLQITALKSANYNNSGWDYTSARINTQDKFSFTYGKVVIRAKIPGDDGTWPALWLLGSNINAVGWPACGEIDLMEEGTVTGFENILSSLHWGTLASPQDMMQSRKVSGSTTDFHEYSMDWRADHIAFYYDGTLLYSQANTSSMPFNQKFFFIFNVAVGGNMGGTNINLKSGSTMYVDYVRVYN
ncbi:Glycosyl hydrolases family 16 [Arachidicoccus rhizosphaerae]|uniref:Glycosyl hydrolases family 16 n=1 Tax=Arachidicoccus rhizosphaerae TaxID=551991 RepID=A0A1H3YLG9_9BACT|nr:glycoside hydrolase family 16 protein [Arachidicoccus rhizosphaerae]SEA11858.1 Glycosyl hydrolases family 16 [Arachidicoccus rhizosphaerae]